MNKNFLALALSVMATTAHADMPKTFVTDSPAFDTIRDTAVAALEHISHPMDSAEFGGAIVLHEGKYYYTNAVTVHDQMELNFKILIHHGDQIVGMYHTHPLEAHDTFEIARELSSFSEGDVTIARHMKIMSYIADGYTKTILSYDWTKHNTTTVTLGELVAPLTASN